MEEFPQQLYDAISRLELTFLECNKLIEVSNRVDTAAWCYNSESKEEKIIFNPEFLDSLDETGCEIVIRHEIQHKALFKELGRLDLDHELLNVALDIAISRVLSRSYKSDAFKGFCEKIYGRGPDNTNTVISLAWYGLDPDRIGNDQIREYYRELWGLAKDPSPIEIYYRILEISDHHELLPDSRRGPLPLPSKGKGPEPSEKPVGRGLAEGTYIRDIPADDLENMGEDDIGLKVLKKGKGEPHYEDWLRELEIEKEQYEALEIEDFIKRIESVDILDRTAERIRGSVHKETRRQMYPFQPTRLGHIYMLTGISQILHQYWNKVSSNRIPRLNIYVDVSPSMMEFREKEVFLIDRLKDLFPSTFFVFGTDVKEFQVSDFAAGKYPVAYGTDFNPVIEHLMDSEVECGVIFTDGEAYVWSANQTKFGRSGKRLFTVYFNNYEYFERHDPNPIRSDLDEISEDVMQIDLFKPQTELSHRVML